MRDIPRFIDEKRIENSLRGKIHVTRCLALLIVEKVSGNVNGKLTVWTGHGSLKMTKPL